MAISDPMIPDTAGIPGELDRVHDTLLALAGSVHRATRVHRAEPRELNALSRQIRQYRRVVRDYLGDDLRRWLENLQQRVEVTPEPAAALAEVARDGTCAVSQTVA